MRGIAGGLPALRFDGHDDGMSFADGLRLAPPYVQCCHGGHFAVANLAVAKRVNPDAPRHLFDAVGNPRLSLRRVAKGGILTRHLYGARYTVFIVNRYHDARRGGAAARMVAGRTLQSRDIDWYAAVIVVVARRQGSGGSSRRPHDTEPRMMRRPPLFCAESIAATMARASAPRHDAQSPPAQGLSGSTTAGSRTCTTARGSAAAGASAVTSWW